MSRKICLTILCTVLALGCRTTGADKEPPYGDSVRLQSRVFQPAPGIADEVVELFAKTEGRVHVIVQFERVPSSAERQRFARDFDVRLLDTLPERAYFVGMPSDRAVASKLAGAEPPAKAFAIIEPSDKLSPGLRKDGVPDTTRRKDGRPELIVLFFGDVDE